MGSESIAHEAEGRMGYWFRGHEGERNTVFIRISAQPRISAHLGWALILKAEKVNKRPPPTPPNQTQISAHPTPPTWVNKF